MDYSFVHSNISQVRRRLSSAASEANRPASDIRLIAVSKTKPIEAIRKAFESGIKDFGENYVAEATDKVVACNDLDITWHFLGPLQSNKTRQVAEYFDWIHSVDRLKIAQRLNAQRSADKEPLNVCIQVNLPAKRPKQAFHQSMICSTWRSKYNTLTDLLCEESWPYQHRALKSAFSESNLVALLSFSTPKAYPVR